MNRRGVLRVVMAIAVCWSPRLAAEPPVVYQVSRDAAQQTTRLSVPMVHGRVGLDDLVRGVSHLRGYDDSHLVGVLPNVTVPVDHCVTKWFVAGFNGLFSGCCRCEIGEMPDGSQTALQLHVDRAASRNAVNDVKGKVRAAWNYLDWRKETITYGVDLPPSAVFQESGERDLVVTIHGLNSRPEELVGLRRAAMSANRMVADFRYPNDQPIEASAELLSRELKRLKLDFPTCQVRLVTHSMGGLVARYALEVAALDPQNVTQLIMVAPPNHGSRLASVANFMDCYEYCYASDRRKASAFVESVVDGLNEAAADLEPDSVFLEKLNRQARNSRVAYTILLGTNGPMTRQELEALQATTKSYTDFTSLLRFAGSKLNRTLSDLDELVQGQGDGAVAVTRGQLDGVSDVVVLPFSHNSVLDPDHEHSQEAQRLITERLSRN